MSTATTNHTQMHAENTEDALLALHDESLSKDLGRACEARAGKVMVNLVTAWLSDEEDRGTDNYSMIIAAKSTAISIFITTLINAAPNDKVAHTIAVEMRENFIAQYDDAVASLLEKENAE